MANSQIFKTAFKGYDKNEVINYVTDINERINSMKNELYLKDSEISRLKDEISELNNSDGKGEVCQAEIDKIIEQTKNQTISELYEKIENEIKEKYKALADEKTKTESDDETYKKARAYDDSKDALAEILIKAQSDANLLVKDAKKEAELIMNSAYCDYEEFCNNFTAMKAKVLAFKDEISELLGKSLEETNKIEEKLLNAEANVLSIKEKYSKDNQ